MIPLALTLKGIYSYQSEQQIDFTALTAASLFGIFGAVGSGKSTILEAISFALYGETERLNQKDNRSYNMMNLKSDRLAIDFIFDHHAALVGLGVFLAGIIQWGLGYLGYVKGVSQFFSVVP